MMVMVFLVLAAALAVKGTAISHLTTLTYESMNAENKAYWDFFRNGWIESSTPLWENASESHQALMKFNCGVVGHVLLPGHFTADCATKAGHLNWYPLSVLSETRGTATNNGIVAD